MLIYITPDVRRGNSATRAQDRLLASVNIFWPPFGSAWKVEIKMAIGFGCVPIMGQNLQDGKKGL